jgi:hypothetical protein
MHTGSCLCRAITFQITCELPPPDACHCTQCRKFCGHIFISTDIPKSALTITGTEHLTWYRSSEIARRGFCAICGSSLFWDPLHRDTIGIAMGAFDTPTNTTIGVHIFVADKGDYYTVADGVPQYLQYPSHE